YIHTGANGDIPVMLTAKPGNLAGMVSKMGDLGAAIDALEYWYGPYPFERVGYVLTTDGALEIPTNIAYPDFMPTQSVINNRGLFTHELGHHWWGDVVTPRIHNDMWLKEGPAEYSAHLIEEWLGGAPAFVKAVKDNQLFVLKQAHLDDGGFQALSPMPDEYIYGTHTYYKGAAVMHNLRGYLGDEVFKQAMHDVQANYAYTDITAEGFKDALEAVTGVDLDPFFDAWVFAPGFAAFEVRDWSLQHVGPTSELTLTIGQKLYGTTQYHNEVPLDFTVISSSGAVFETSIVASGQESTVVVNCPFDPAMIVLNRHNRLNQARMDDEITVVPGETFNTILPYTQFRLYENTLVDSTLVRIDHMWSAPDQTPLSEDIIAISNTHYYNVDGLWPEGTSLRGRLYYYGSSVNDLDHDLIQGDETGIVLVWRPNPMATWEVYWDQTVNAGSLTNSTGYITMNTLEKGQYTFAKGTIAIGMDELSTDRGELHLFPVPTQGDLTVSGTAPPNSTLMVDVFGTDGRLVRRSTLKAAGDFATTLDLGDIVDGTYVLRVMTASGKFIGTRRFELAR
ncbi:MAG TPA: M1 family aminopeptidase, partial [Flavobacteriales bacterium]|nr:M1 family aminopeptidase [Flavobacteriales bacterium]